MMNNERGMTYPLTCILLLSFTMFVGLFLEQYTGEKRVYTMSDRIISQEYYFLYALNSVERDLQAGDERKTGDFIFKKGKVTYTISEPSEQSLLVSFAGELDTGEEWIGIGTYDKEEEKMVKWIERRS